MSDIYSKCMEDEESIPKNSELEVQPEKDKGKNLADDAAKEKKPEQAKWCPEPIPYSINNRLILETYTKEGLKASVTNGFAMVDQKISLKGLKALVQANINMNGVYCTVNKGDLVYIREEYLHSQKWAQARYKSDAIQEDFMIVDAQYVEFVVPK